MKKILFPLFIFYLICPIQTVFAAPASENVLPVLSRGHIQDLGDFPQDGSWVQSPEIIGTVGQSKRIEGFELKTGDSLPAGLELRYNVHVQNIGWLYDEDNPSTWAKNGDYAGTRGESLRIEAIKIVLLDATGNKATDYHIRYQGHIQNVGDQPADSEKWYADGEQLGTVGSSLRLEALKLEITRDTAANNDLSSYNALMKQVEVLNAADYSKTSWTNLQESLNKNKVNDQSSQEAVDTAVKNITAVITQLENLTKSTIYNKAGTYGPTSQTETIKQDVVITSRDVTLQNLVIEGNLIIDEAVGDGNVTLNNVRVSGELRVRGGGQNSIHINGGDYAKIRVEQAPDGGVRIVATGLDGVPVVLGENAAGETLILEGSFESVTVLAPDVVLKTQGQTSIKTFDVAGTAQNAAINLGSNTQVTNLAVSAPVRVTGTGTVANAEVAADNVVFEKAPANYTVDPGVVVPPVIPTPQPGSGGSSGGGGYTPPSKISLSVTTAPTVISSKTYDGTIATNVTNQVLEASAISGIVSGDDVTVKATATYDNKNVGTGKAVTITFNLVGTDSGKYTAPAGTTLSGGEIAKANLTLPAPVFTKIYDGTKTATQVVTPTTGKIVGDDLSVSATISFDSADAGTNKSGTCAYALSGSEAANYNTPVAQAVTGGEITPKPVKITGTTVEAKSYDGNDTATVKTAGSSSDFVIGDDVTVAAIATYDNKNIGSGKTVTIIYSLAGTDAGNYTAPAGNTLSSGEIVKANLTLSAPAFTKTYDGTKTATQVVTPTAGKIAGDDLSVSATISFDSADAGTNKSGTCVYTLSGNDAVNYNTPANTSATGEITAVALVVNGVTGLSKEYDGTNNGSLSVALTPKNSADQAVFTAETGNTLAYSTSSSKYFTNQGCLTEAKEPGSGYWCQFEVTLSGASAGNYTVFDSANAGIYDTTAHTFDGITAGGVITKKTLNLTWENTFATKYGAIKSGKPYDGNQKVFYAGAGSVFEDAIGTTTIANFDTGSEIIVVTPTATYNDKNAGSDKTITVTYVISGTTSSSRYQIATETINQASIAKRQLTVSGANVPTAAAKTYDGTTDVFAGAANTQRIYGQPVTPDNAVNGDSVTLVANASYANANAQVDKPVTITYKLTSGAENYLLPANTTGKATITPLTLTVGTINSASKTKEYDGTNSGNLGIGVSCSANPTLFKSEVTGTSPALGIERSSSYYNSANTVPVTEPGTGLAIRYTLTLNGTSAGNYAFTGGASTISDYTTGGSITPKTLTIAPPSIKTARDYDGTLTVYDTSGNPIANSYTVAPAQITGLIGQDNVDVTATMAGAGKDAGTQTITISYSWSGYDNSNYLLPAPQTITVTINQLPLTVAANNVPAVDATKKYDGTTATNVTNTPVAVSGVLVCDTANVSATATATYADKNAGSGKAITIAYSLGGAAAKNYQVPAEDKTKTAAITPRILGYTNCTLDAVKKADGTSVVNITSASIDPTKSTPGTDVIVPGEESKLTLTCSADYYTAETGGEKTNAIGQHPIKLAGTLSGGTEAGNYVMIDNYTYGNGEILAANAVITAAYGYGWSSWSGTGANLTPPTGVSNFTLFCKDNSNYYGLGSDGKIYRSADLSNWSQYTSNFVAVDNNLSSSYQLIGIDATSGPLAIDSSGNLYNWIGGWGNIGPIPDVSNPINPTYYAAGATKYLIYQDAVGLVYQKNLNINSQTQIANQLLPPLPAGFSHTLLVYNGTTLTSYAY